MQKNFQLVCDETVRISMALFDDVWGQQDEVAVNHCVEYLTMPVSITVNLKDLF
jgi:hypothetical protein